MLISPHPGIITKDLTRDRQWASARLVLTMIKAFINNKLVQGSRDWSVVMSKALSLAMMVALVSRAGDITKSSYAPQHCFMKYSDIVLKIVRGESLDNVKFEASIIIRYAKAHKDDGAANETITCDSLDDPTHNCIDPIKLLIIMALRTGNIKGASSLKDMVRSTLSRLDRTVQWAYPDRPVLAAFTGHGTLAVQKAASTFQLLRNLNNLSQVSGIKERLWTHDIRRGGARDTSQLSRQFDMGAAQDALGHSNVAAYRGTTKEYVGRKQASKLLERLSLPNNDAFTLEPTLPVSEPKVKKARTDGSAITTFLAMPENAKYAKYKNPRDRAGAALRAQAHSDKVQAIFDTPVPMLLENRPALKDKTAQNNSNKRTHSQATDTNDLDHNDIDQNNVDPKLQTLHSFINGTHDMDEHDLLALDDENEEYLMLQQRVRGIDLDSSSDKFIDTFAKINSYLCPSLHKERIAAFSDEHLRGGSRDLPSFHQFHCHNRNIGCKFESLMAYQVIDHQEEGAEPCSAVTIKRIRELNERPSFTRTCDHPGCGKILTAKTNSQANISLQRHKQSHELPWKCSIGGTIHCDREMSYSVLKRHKLIYHNGYTPRSCPLDKTHADVYEKRDDLKQHLQTVHNIHRTKLGHLLDKQSPSD